MPSLCDATGKELRVGDIVGTVTGGQNAMVITGRIKTVHSVKVTVEVLSCEFVGEPVGRYHPGKVEPGADKQLNAYRVFRLGPCVHESTPKYPPLDIEDLRFDVFRLAAPMKKVRVTVLHVPTGCSHTEMDYSELEAKARALQVLTAIVSVHKGLR